MPANYKKAHKAIMQFYSSAAVNPNLTRFLGTQAEATEIFTYIRVPFSGHLCNLFAQSHAAAGVGETYTYTVRINGVNTIITCNHGGAVDTQSEDIVNQAAVVQGDVVTVMVVISVGAVAAIHNCTLVVKG